MNNNLYKQVPNLLKEKSSPSVYSLSNFRSQTREAFNKAETGEEVLIVRHGAIFALISVELALKHQPLGERLK